MGDVDHVDRFHLEGGGFLLSPRIRTPGLIIIVAVQPLILVFGVYLAGLFEHPAVSIGVVGWLVRGAMNLAQALQYTVQTGRSLIIYFERRFPLTRFRSAESGVDRRVFCVVAIVPSLMPVTLWLAVSIAAARRAGMWRGAAASQPTTLTHTKAGH